MELLKLTHFIGIINTVIFIAVLAIVIIQSKSDFGLFFISSILLSIWWFGLSETVIFVNSAFLTSVFIIFFMLLIGALIFVFEEIKLNIKKKQ